MKKLLILTIMMICFIKGEAQTIINPVFERTDTPSFRVKKIKITKDTTIIHCSYQAEENSWASISKETYIEEVTNGKKYQILKVEGIPFSPEKREFDDSCCLNVILYFPHVTAKKINIIEDESNEAFNIYGIDFNASYNTFYTEYDIDEFRQLAVNKENEKDWASAIHYTLKQLEASRFVYGLNSLPCAWAMYNLTMEYPNTKENEKTIEWGNKAIELFEQIAQDTSNMDYLARSYGNVSLAYLKKAHTDTLFYRKALLYGEKALNIRNKIHGPNHELYANSLYNYACVQEAIGNTQIAIDSLITAYKIYQQRLGKYHPQSYQAMRGLIQFYLHAQKFDDAISMSMESLKICDSLYSQKSSQYISLLSTIQYVYYSCNKIHESVVYANKAYQLSKVVFDKNDSRINVMLLNLMRLYNLIGKYDDIIQIGQENIESVKQDLDLATTLSDAYKDVEDYKNAIYIKEYAVNNTIYPSYEYINEMDGLGGLCISNGDYQRSKSIYEELLYLCDSIAIKDSTIYSMVLSHAATTYSHLGDHNNSIRLGEKCLQIRRNLVKQKYDIENSLPNYLNSLVNYASDMINNNFKSAIALSYLNEALQFIEDNKDWYTDTLRYSRILAIKGYYYRKIGKVQDAIDNYKLAANLQKGLCKNEHFDYSNTLCHLSKVYEELQDYETAYDYALEAKSYLERRNAEKHPEYADVIDKLACLNFFKGNYPQALKMIKEVIDIFRFAYGESPNYARILNNIAALYLNIGDLRNSSICYKKAFDILESSKSYDNGYSITCLGVSDFQTDNDSILYYLNKAEQNINHQTVKANYIVNSLYIRKISFYLEEKRDTLEALRICKEAMEYQTRTIGKQSLDYADLLDAMSTIIKGMDLCKSFQYCDSAFQIRKQILSNKDLSYAKALLKYTNGILKKEGRVDCLIEYYRTISDIMVANFNKSVLSVPYKNANTFWQLQFRDFFDTKLPSLCCSQNSESSNSLLYDALLFSKGLLLSVDMNLRNFILTSRNKNLTSLFEEYNKLSIFLNAQKALPIDERSCDIDSIMRELDNMGWSLAKKITECGYNMLNKTTWADVRDKLKEKEIAIEFGKYTDQEENVLYYALVINNHSKAPMLYNLFKEAELNNLLRKEKADSLELSNLIWGKLHNEIINASNVFFSPSGKLDLLGIEYLPIWNKGAEFTPALIRLSSTRELRRNRNNNRVQKAVLYGGIDYNSKKQDEKGDATVFFDKQYTGLTRAISNRGSFDYLVNTIEEIRQISKILMGKGITCETRESIFGTEESLKGLSGIPVDILHLATHGMYINPDETDKSKYKFILSDKSSSSEEYAMSRSFIVMSGGNMLFYNDSINTENDGIMTANDISYLDLHNIDLVTLSACDSGKGDISHDGIVGLQRGFKKAGVRSLMMSLNKVDDEATKILMVEFYKNLMNGKTKHQSLKDAQKYLRQVENGKYDKPEYWASFIMLDGLN
ncbi:MAG: CHAT domain-containing protein [Bacilli bacterium]|nr:CHAT domain-containing protein [Lachnospiraceae bacterium]MBR0439319.1 CHAT domain-containing protein [Bacilli bacterium]